jgi:hypothetical protein
MKNVLQKILILSLLTALVACPSGSLTIIAQPKSLTVCVDQTATFAVAAVGLAPLVYEWRKNSAIVGTNTNTYTTLPLALTDSGSLIQVKVSDISGSVTSSVATLTVVDKFDPSCLGGNWVVPKKHWDARFKVTYHEIQPGSSDETTIVEGTAKFANAPSAVFQATSSVTIASVSGEFTVSGLTTFTTTAPCKKLSKSGQGTIKPNEGFVLFFPDDLFIPTQLGYFGTGDSTATVTSTFLDCSEKPVTTDIGFKWLRIPLTETGLARYFTSPNLLSFSDTYTDKPSPNISITYEWSFTRTD